MLIVVHMPLLDKHLLHTHSVPALRQALGMQWEPRQTWPCPAAAYGLVLRWRTWILELDCLGSNPSFTTTQLCGLGQVT